MIHVAGGTYTEICHFPYWRQLFGSGGRAASVLAGLSDGVVLSTFSDKDNVSGRQALADCYGFDLAPTVNAPEIFFEYLQPLRCSAVWPENALADDAIKVTAPTVLRYGCWEGEVVVDADIAVYDPQSPGRPRHFGENGSRAGRLAIVCNLDEGRLLTGRHDATDVAVSLVTEHGAEVVVLKAGPLGALVQSRNGSAAKVPAYAAERVFPIGSGDVYSAVFAYYWAEQGLAAHTAADLASKAAAWYCATSAFPKGPQWEASSPIEWRPVPTESIRTPKVYLAGPFFSVPQLWFIEELWSELAGMGMEVFSPYHHVGSPPSAKTIATKDLEGLRSCDVVLAVLDGLDPGTIFEVGYARSIDIPVVAISQQRIAHDFKMFEGTDVVMEADVATAVYKTVWAAIERAK